MPRRKHKKKRPITNKEVNKKIVKAQAVSDFTLDDCANAPKPINYIRNSSAGSATDRALEEYQQSLIIPHVYDDTIEVMEKKSNANKKTNSDMGIEYPEIFWYLLSKYIRPEDVSSFARLNKAAYSVTKKSAFWINLYKNYCNVYSLPDKLRAEVSKKYGLRQTVIRCLCFSYDVMSRRIILKNREECKPQSLINRVCINVWYYKAVVHWYYLFKLKIRDYKRVVEDSIDANVEDGCQVLQITCGSLHDIPPLMGMTLSSVSKTLAPGLQNHKVELGFTSSRYATKETLPEITVVLDTVVGVMIYDWWHPNYPHSGNLIPRQGPQFLVKDFFDDDSSGDSSDDSGWVVEI